VSRRANPTLIGGFVLGGAVLAVIAVVVFGSGRFFSDTATFISFFDGSVNGLDAGSPVRFRGIDVGSVRDVLLDLPGVGREERDLRIAVVYDLDRKALESRGAMARLSNPFDVDTLLALGIRAELATESLVTGRKYISLDLDPERPVSAEPVPGAPYPEIPTVTTGFERIEEEAYGLIAELGALRLDTLVTVATEAFARIGQLAATPEMTAAIQALPGTLQRLDSAVADLQSFVARIDTTLTPMGNEVTRTAEQATLTLQRLDSTLSDVDAVLGNAGGLLEPESPLYIRYERAMTDLGDASRALRDLADYLQRNPSALLRGRPGGNQ